MKALTFGEIPVGTTFRALRNDVIGRGPEARIVNNNGIYTKVGSQVAVDVSHGNKECIFLLGMPVREIKTVMHIDYKSLEAYKVSQKGRVAA